MSTVHVADPAGAMSAQATPAEHAYMSQHEIPELMDTLVAYLIDKQPAEPRHALIAFLCKYKGIEVPAGIKEQYVP